MTRYLYLTRHGAADAFGGLTDTGAEQSYLLGRRLAHLPIDTVWHSPLPRAAESAHHLARQLSSAARVAEAPELMDHIPDVPPPDKTPAEWRPVFDGYDTAEAEAGRHLSSRLIERFATATATSVEEDSHEVLVTHSYPIAWIVRDALEAPSERWLELNSANTDLTVIVYVPGRKPSLAMFNDMSHLPEELRWTGFAPAPRP